MATYIPDNSLDTLNQSLQFMTQQNSARKQRDMAMAEMLNRQGKNKEAEALILSSQRGLLGNLFGKDAQEWTVQNPFSKEEIALKQMQSLNDMQTNASQDQGAILADLKITNPEMYNYMIKQEADKKASAGFDETMPGHVNASDRTIKNQSKYFDQLRGLYGKALDERDKSNAPILQANQEAAIYNKRAEASNVNNIQLLGGNEVDQQQTLLNQTMNAVNNGGGMAAYNKYLATTKAIDDHYQHNGKALPPEYFGLGGKANGKGSGAPDQYLYGDSEQVIDIPKSEMSTSAKREAYIQKMYPDIYAKGTILKKAGTNSGETLNPLQKEQLKASANENDMMFKAAAAQAWNEADPDGINIFNKKDRAELANRSLPSDNPYKFDENGNIVRGNGNVAVKPWK